MREREILYFFFLMGSGSRSA